MLFLYLCYVCIESRYKVATLNYVPRRMVCVVFSGGYYSFLHFYNLASKVATRLLCIAVLLRSWHAVLFLCLCNLASKIRYEGC